MGGGIESLRRGLEILKVLANAGPSGALELGKISQQIHIKRTTLYRYMSTLESLGYVERDNDTRSYRLGSAVLELAAGFLAGKELVLEADALMWELAIQTRETVYLATLDRDSMLYLHKREPPFPHTHMPAGAGSRRPAYASSLGKAVLAFLPEEKVDEVLAYGMPALTPKTPTTPAALKEQLEVVRRRGYALDMGEQQLHVRCAGAPIFGYGGRVIGAISVAGTVETLTDERLAQIGLQVRETARKISRRMGGLLYPFQTLVESAEQESSHPKP